MLALALALVASQPLSAACAESDRFTFRVERADQALVEGVVIHVEAGGPQGVREAADTVKNGVARVCIFGGVPGEFVVVRVGEAAQRVFRLLYPPGGRLPITHQGSPTVVVCEVERDCDLSREVADRVVRLVKPSVERLTAREKQLLFEQWRGFLEEQGVRQGALVEALRRKERQVQASVAASELLSRFDARAQEVVDRFRENADRALDYASGGPLQQIKAAIEGYAPVFWELREKTDGYRKATADAWGEPLSARFQALVDEARAIHERMYEPLNAIVALINDCRNGWKCPDKERARARAREGAETIAVDVGARLKAFGERKRAFLEGMNEALFEAQGRAPAAATR